MEGKYFHVTVHTETTLSKLKALVVDMESFKDLLRPAPVGSEFQDDVRRCGLVGREIADRVAPQRPARASKFMNARCECPDYFDGSVRWCKHIAALGFLVVHIADVQPVRFLDVLGMSLADLVTEGVAQQAAGAFGTPTDGGDPSDAEGEIKTEAARPAKRLRAWKGGCGGAGSAIDPFVLH